MNEDHAVQGGGETTRTEKFESALDFLDKVKEQFATRPDVYNQFLDIMKDFKAHVIDTSGVIGRVTHLFAGHRHLILGFNRFLPPGYKIEPHMIDDMAVLRPDANPGAEHDRLVAAQLQAKASAEQQQAQLQQQNIAQQQQLLAQQASFQQQKQLDADKNESSSIDAARKQPEFNHARNYVKKIKMRFIDQPQVYKAFLEILHIYHKEQLTIKEVYEQVATLFASHDDLLDEFTQFLPDPVQQQQQAAAPKKRRKPARQAAQESHREQPTASSTQEKKTRRGRAQEPVQVRPSADEIAFFDSVKKRVGQHQYEEFLKALDLFSSNVLSRTELILVARDALCGQSDLLAWFCQLVGFDDATLHSHFGVVPLVSMTPADKRALEKEAEEHSRLLKGAQEAWHDMSFDRAERAGPSYRKLPDQYPLLPCSGRTPLSRSVLNDEWVGVPTGSEEFGFRASRKNPYEESLFKLEDDRFELDLLIEHSNSLLRRLKPLLEQLQQLDTPTRVKLTGLTTLERRALLRMYGDKGEEILHLLETSPHAAIPVVVERLEAKTEEWCHARNAWQGVWRNVLLQNSEKALDHQSYAFKQADRKATQNKALLAEIMMASEKGRSHDDDSDSDSDAAASSSSSVELEGLEAVRLQPHMAFTMTNKNIHDDICELLTFFANKSMSKVDREKVDVFIRHFARHFFSHGTQASDSIGSQGAAAAAAAAFAMEPDQDNEDGEDEVVEEAVAIPQLVANAPALFFGDSNFYLFFRFYQIVYERLHIAAQLAAEQKSRREAGETPAWREQTGICGNAANSDEDPYALFLNYVYNLAANGIDQTEYETACRRLLGINAYVVFTLDRVLTSFSRSLQSLLVEESAGRLLSLHAFDCKRGSAAQGRTYLNEVRTDLGEDEDMFMVQFVNGQLRIRLLADKDISRAPRYVSLSPLWGDYIEAYVTGIERPKKHSRIYLSRAVNSFQLESQPPVVVDDLQMRMDREKRLRFVDGTEDVWSVGRARSNEAVRQKMDGRGQKSMADIVEQIKRKQ